jgi:hypothetical protein
MLSSLDSAKEIERACARGGGFTASKFIDQKFPPSLCSILGTGTYFEGKHKDVLNLGHEDIDSLDIPVSCKDIEWLRPNEFASKEKTHVLWTLNQPKPSADVVASPHTPNYPDRSPGRPDSL